MVLSHNGLKKYAVITLDIPPITPLVTATGITTQVYRKFFFGVLVVTDAGFF